jgi:hypothetical protein
MASADVNSIIRAYLVTQASLTTLIGGATPRLYCPRLPENCTLPAVGFFTRGGSNHPMIRAAKTPSVQFDCWGNNPIEARTIYRALFDIFQGIGGYYEAQIPVVIGAGTYYILSAQEESVGQDL